MQAGEEPLENADSAKSVPALAGVQGVRVGHDFVTSVKPEANIYELEGRSRTVENEKTHKEHVKCSSSCSSIAFASRSAICNNISDASSSFFESVKNRSSSSSAFRLHSCSFFKSAFSRLTSSVGVIRTDRRGSEVVYIFSIDAVSSVEQVMMEPPRIDEFALTILRRLGLGCSGSFSTTVLFLIPSKYLQ